MTTATRFKLDDNETNKTKSELSYLKKSVDALEAAILGVLWHEILQRFHCTSNSLQHADMTRKLRITLQWNREFLPAFTG